MRAEAYKSMNEFILVYVALRKEKPGVAAAFKDHLLVLFEELCTHLAALD